MEIYSLPQNNNSFASTVDRCLEATRPKVPSFETFSLAVQNQATETWGHSTILTIFSLENRKYDAFLQVHFDVVIFACRHKKY
jgi:hypothetical protein